MYRILSERNDKTAGWLKHAVWIAAHTGARESAIAELEYDAVKKNDLVSSSQEGKNRQNYPCTPGNLVKFRGVGKWEP